MPSVVDNNGDIRDVSAADASRGFASGEYHPISSEEVARADRADAESGIGGQLRTMGEQALEGAGNVAQLAGRGLWRALSAQSAIDAAGSTSYDPRMAAIMGQGLTPGAMPLPVATPDALLGEKGFLPQVYGAFGGDRDALRREMSERAQVNPMSAEVGKFVGQTAPLLAASGGTAALARGVVGGEGVAANITRAAIQAGLEGGTLGATEASLDPGSDAEHIMAGFGMGALLGAGTGAAMGGLGAIFHRSPTSALGMEATEQADRELAARALGEAQATEASERIGGRGAKIYNSTVSTATGAPRDMLEDVGLYGARNAEAVAAERDLPKIIEETSMKMRPIVQETEDSLNELSQVFRSAPLKRSNLEKLVGSGYDTPERIATAKAMIGDTTMGMIEAIEQLPDEGVRGSLKRDVRRALRAAEQTYEASSKGQTTALEQHEYADNLKRVIQNSRKNMAKSIADRGFSGTAFEREEIQSVISRFDELESRIRGGLEDSGVWGEKVAAAQKNINAILSGEGTGHGAIEAMQDFGKNFMRYTGHDDYFTGKPIFAADPAKFAESLSNTGSTRGAFSDDAFRRYTQAVPELAKKLEENYELTATQKAAVKKIVDNVEQMKAAFADVSGKAELANKLGELKAYGINTHLGPLSLLTQPYEMAKAAGQIRAARERINGRVMSGVSDWIKGGAKSKPIRLPPIKSGGTVVTSAVLSAFTGGGNLRKTYEKRCKQLREADPEKLASVLDQHMDPAVLMSAGQTASAAIQYMQQYLPALPQSQIMRPHTAAASVPMHDMIKFGQAWGTLVHPETAVADLRSGKLTPTQVDALKNVYPRIYEELREQTLDAIAEADMAGHKVPINTRLQLALLLDLDGAGEPSLTTAFADQVRNLAAKQQKPKQPRGGASRSGKVRASLTTPLSAATGALS